MSKEGKTILAILAGTILLIGGLAFVMTRSAGGSGGGSDSFILNEPAPNLETSPSGSFDLGKVAYAGGIVSKSFEVKNTLGKDIKLRKITTSCMCTTAKFVVNGKETKLYGMEMSGDLNPLINFNFLAGASGRVVFDFDPAAHGPAGVGPFERVVTLFFDSGYKDFQFNGEVTK